MTDPKAQRNFTDPESKIMKTSNKSWDQCGNAPEKPRLKGRKVQSPLPTSCERLYRNPQAEEKLFLNSISATFDDRYQDRLPACVPFSLIGAISVYWFASQLYGRTSGIVAMCLWCISPNMLGNAAIITPDLVGGALAISAAFAFWRWVRSPVWSRSLVAGDLVLEGQEDEEGRKIPPRRVGAR